MNRRILLIDADPAFRASLAQQLARYRFDIASEPDAERAFALAASEPPTLVMVAVEEPDKAGFKVFQRCKKGALGGVPIMLVTSSVAPESFAKHRGLKIHADDYLDKRSIGAGELLGKIDGLVGLGEPADVLDVSHEADEIALSSDDMVLEETVGEDDGDPGGDGQRVDSMVDAETDAAFALLLGVDTPAAPAVEPAPLPAAEPEPEPEPEPGHAYATDAHATDALPVLSDEPRTSDEEPSVVIAAVPAPIHDTDRPQDSGGIDFDSFSREAMRPPVDLIARARAQHRAQDRARQDQLDAGSSAIPIDVDDLEQVDDDEVPPLAPAPEPQILVEAPLPAAPPAPAPTPAAEPVEVARPRPAEPPPAAEPRAQAAAPVREHTGSYNSVPVPDLGLDELARAETTTDHSGVFDRRALRKIGELERQIAQLKTELDRARASADATARGNTREREFLNLREQITAKDRDVQRARDELRTRDRELAELADKLRETQQARAALEARAAELEQRSAADAGRAAALETRDRATANHIATLSQELEARTHTATTAEAARVQLERELAGERALRAANASDAERALRLEREQLVARHQAELAGARGEAGTARDAALAELRAELDAERAAAVAAAIAATRSELTGQAERAARQLEAAHAAELARRDAEQRAALAELTEQRDQAIARVASEREDAVAAVDDEHHQVITRLQSERAAELAQARDDAALQVTHARDELLAELSYVRQEAETRIAAIAGSRDRAVAERVAETDRLARELAEARTEHEQALGAAVADHAAALDDQARGHAEELARRDADHAAARARRDQGHAEELARRDHEHTTARGRDAAAHRDALAAVRAELEQQTADHAATLEAARAELDALVDDHRRAAEELVQSSADELAEAAAERRRVEDDHQRALDEARAAAERLAAQHRAELDHLAAAAEQAVAEQRAAASRTQRALDDATARHHAEREAAERAAGKALDDQRAQHERALAVAQGEAARARAAADAEHTRALAAAAAEHDRQRRELAAEHARQLGEVTTERDELRRGLSSARDSQKRSEAELASAVHTIADRNAELRAHAAAIAERDQRIAELRREIEAIEHENASYQEQVLRAYQKIKADEAMVARAKKAMAIALTVLDDPANPKPGPD